MIQKEKNYATYLFIKSILKKNNNTKMEEVNEVIEKLEVRINMLQLTKEDIEMETQRSKIKDTEKEAK